MDKERIRWLLIFSVLFLISASEPCAEMCSCSAGTVNCSHASLVKITFDLEEDAEVLDLSYNLIEILHNEFFSKMNVTYVTSIYLNDNCIKSVEPEVFIWFGALRHLYLQNNKINSLHPSSFQSNTNLITLDLSGNVLTAVDPKIFEEKYLLSWVNFIRNPLNASTISPIMFSFSLNTLDIEMCGTPKYFINSFQNIPIFENFNLTESKMFSVETFMSYQSTELQEISSENYVFSKLSKLGFDGFSIFRYDEIHEVIFSPSNSSLICFCSRLSAWFWCYDETFQCTIHISDIHSLLNCKETSEVTSTISSYITASSPVASTTVVNESYTNIKGNESISAITSIVVYITVAVVVAVAILVIFTTLYIRKRRANTRVTEGRVHYTPVASAISEPLHYDSVDVTNLPHPRATASGSAARADIIRDIRVENAEFSSFQGF
jgi:hypothetical protein